MSCFWSTCQKVPFSFFTQLSVTTVTLDFLYVSICANKSNSHNSGNSQNSTQLTQLMQFKQLNTSQGTSDFEKSFFEILGVHPNSPTKTSVLLVSSILLVGFSLLKRSGFGQKVPSLTFWPGCPQKGLYCKAQTQVGGGTGLHRKMARPRAAAPSLRKTS